MLKKCTCSKNHWGEVMEGIPVKTLKPQESHIQFREHRLLKAERTYGVSVTGCVPCLCIVLRYLYWPASEKGCWVCWIIHLNTAFNLMLSHSLQRYTVLCDLRLFFPFLKIKQSMWNSLTFLKENVVISICLILCVFSILHQRFWICSKIILFSMITIQTDASIPL